MSPYRVSGPAELARAPWRKSARSGNVRECVEVAELAGGHRGVRDSKDPTGPALIVTLAAWTAFTTSLRSGHFR